MQQPTVRKLVLQTADQLVRQHPFGRTDRIGIPLGAFKVVDGHERRLAAHGQPHVAGLKPFVDLLAQRVQRIPRFVRERLGDARMFGRALHLHVEREFHFGKAGDTGDRRGIGVMRRRGQRNMAFAGQQPRCRVQPDPARTGQIHLDPGVQVGEIMVGARRPVQRDQVGFQLDQIARHKPRRDAQIAQDLHQQPTAVAARPRRAAQRHLGRLNAGLHADLIVDLRCQTHVQPDQKVDRDHLVARYGFQESAQLGRQRLGFQIDRQVVCNLRAIGEWKILGAVLDEKVEGVIDGHIRDQIDLDLELAHRLGKDQPRHPVAVGVLLVVHEMLDRRHRKRMRYDPRARMRRRAQPDDLRPQRDGAVVLIMGQVVNAGGYRHWHLLSHTIARHRRHSNV